MPERFVGGMLERMAVEDDAHVVFDLEEPGTGSRTAVQIEASWSGQDRPGNRIVGSTGEMHVGSPIKVLDAWGNAHEVATQQPVTGYGIAGGKDPSYSGFVGMIREMCRCIRTNRQPIYDAERAADAMALIGACYLSEMRGGKSVGLDEFKGYALELKRRQGDNAADAFIRQVSEHIADSAGRR